MKPPVVTTRKVTFDLGPKQGHDELDGQQKRAESSPSKKRPPAGRYSTGKEGSKNETGSCSEISFEFLTFYEVISMIYKSDDYGKCG